MSGLVCLCIVFGGIQTQLLKTVHCIFVKNLYNTTQKKEFLRVSWYHTRGECKHSDLAHCTYFSTYCFTLKIDLTIDLSKLCSTSDPVQIRSIHIY